MTIHATANSASQLYPQLIDADAYLEDQQAQYLANGITPPIGYLLLAGGQVLRDTNISAEARLDAWNRVGLGKIHPQTHQLWDQVDAADPRLLTRQELYQPLHQRQAYFTWRHPDLVQQLSALVHDDVETQGHSGSSFPQSLADDLDNIGMLTIGQMQGFDHYRESARVLHPSGWR